MKLLFVESYMKTKKNYVIMILKYFMIYFKDVAPFSIHDWSKNNGLLLKWKKIKW